MARRTDRPADRNAPWSSVPPGSSKFTCGLGFAKGRLSWDDGRWGISLASGPRPPACTPHPGPPLSPLREQVLRRQSLPRLAVERLPPASGTNPRLSEGAPGTPRLLPSALSQLFSPSRGPGCALRPLLPPGPPALPTALLLVAPGSNQDSGALRILSLEPGPTQTPDVLSCGPCSLLLAIHRRRSRFPESALFVPAALTCKLGHLLTPGPPHLAENYPAVFTFHVCFHFFLYAHAPHTLFPWG